MSNDVPKRPEEPGPRFYYDNVAIDNLTSVCLELGASLWVNQERLRLLEKLLTENGKVTTEMIEQYVPSEAEIMERKTARDAFIGRIYGAFGRVPEDGGQDGDI